MSEAFDDRLVTLAVNFEGQTVSYDQNFYIYASGTKYTNGNIGEAIIRIDNIAKVTRDLLVTKTSQWVTPRQYVNIILSAGRKSSGTFVLFTGQATACNPSQPPDIGLIFKSLTQAFMLGNIGAFGAPPITDIKTICTQIAKDLNVTLDFQATNNKNIENYSFTGPALKQIIKLNQMGGISAFIDNDTLVVLDSQTPRKSPRVMISTETGMIGVPQITDLGVSVKLLINEEIKVGYPVTVKSDINPAANGDFFIFKLSFEIASRDTSFYWLLDLRPAALAIGFHQ